MSKIRAKMAPDGGAEVHSGWTPKGVKSFPMVDVVRLKDNCHMCIRKDEFEADGGEAYRLITDSEALARPAQAPAGQAAEALDPMELARMRVADIQELPAWKALPESVRAVATTKSEMVAALTAE